MKKALYSLTIALLFLSLPGWGQSPTAPALGFNVFLQNGATLVTNETEGPVAMGGDMTLSGSSYQVATNSAGTYQVSGVTVSLLVGGLINYTSGNGVTVNSNGYVKIGNSTGSYVWYTDQNNAYSPIRITPGANYNGSPRINMQANAQQLGVSAVNNPVFQGSLINFTTAFNTMKNSSTCMSGLTDNASLTNANGVSIPHTNLPSQVKLTLNTGLNVLNLTGTDLNNVTNFTFNNAPSATKYLIINVNAAGTFNWNVFTAGGIGFSSCPYVLFNFYNTTNLNIQGGGAIEGTVFAPYAEIVKTVNQANIEGQVIAKSFNHSGGEVHYAVFTPVISGCGTLSGFTINNNSQCLTGNSFAFTNTSTGSSLTYSWKFGDGGTSTSTSPTHVYAAAGTYEVKLKATGSGGTDSITHNVTVNPMVTPSVTISSNVGTNACDGSTVVFTATPVNGGTTPVYQWKKNGSAVGSNSPTYTTNSLVDGDEIKCYLTSNATCRTVSTVYSNIMTMSVSSNVTPYVLIWPLNTGFTTSVCAGSPVTIAAYPFNGGSTPDYQWLLNGMAQGSDSSKLVINTPVDGDSIVCIITSSASCLTTPNDTSNSVVLEVNPMVTPTVSVSASTGSSICPSTSVTFTATPTNEGSSPVYQWKKNGSNVGSGGTTYTTSSISNNDVITCVLTSNASCATTATATSSPLTMTVNPIVTPTVSISANPGTTVCSGASVTFTATPVNGGASPSYQWKKNGVNVGTNSNTYTTSSLASGNTITCTMTSNAPCVTTSTANSNTLTMTVNSTVVPSLTINANPGTTLCSGTPVSFSVTPVNGGSTPAYQWKKNGTNVGNTSTSYTLNAPANNDVITCELTSNAGCASPTTVLSNALTMAITQTVTPSVTIGANPGTSICTGTSVTFTATPTSGGSTPAYQWKKNGSNVGTNSATYTNAALSNNDVITCVLTSNASCATTTTATSNTLTITIASPVTPSVTISANPSGAICAGTSVTFTATPVNGGATPSYQWKRNGSNEGTNSATFTTTSLSNNDVISCVMTSNASCTTTPTATSNNITMSVTAPVTPSVTISANPGTSVCANTSVTFTAVPVNGGLTPTYQWKKNGVVVGSNSPTYILSSPANGDAIVCKMTTSAGCASPQDPNSNTLTMAVTAAVTPAVSIAANTSTTICQGTPVTFTATPTNGGSVPSYQWKKNGNNEGTNSNTYTPSTLNNNDVISCVMTSNASCASIANATSNGITMTVTSTVTPSVSINANPGTTICPGTSVTFTATPVNGGSTPAYQWKKNGSNVGTNSSTYTFNAFNNNDVVTCVMTGSASCASAATATSNGLTMTVGGSVTPSVSIAANPGNPVCAGTAVSFTATPANGGAAPSYQWKKNGVNDGTNNPVYAPASLSNNDVISCVMTSNASCATTTTATSSNITMSIGALVTPSVTISSNPSSPVCAGTPVSFTASPVNGGAAPSYQWKKNGVNDGTNSAIYSPATLNNNDVISCVMTSNASCVTSATATSNNVTMTINPAVTPSVNISANPSTTVCTGTPVIFTATPVNGGTTPFYQWKKNGANVGTNSTSYTLSGPANNDVITCVLTSNATCASTTTATSNALTMTVGSSVTPSVTIAANPSGPICSGTSVTFTATPVNGGSTPAYQWKKNGNNVGINSASYIDNGLSNNDVISCVLTSNASCAITSNANSNNITMAVNPAVAQPGAFTTSSPITYQGQVNVTYTVPNVPGVTYAWSYTGANVTIAGSGNSVTLTFGVNATSGDLSVTASVAGGCAPSAPRTVSILVKPYITWICNSGTNWNDPTNWDCGFLPYGTISVLIPATASCKPSVFTTNGSCRDLMIDAGTHVWIDNNIVLNVSGNLRLDGNVINDGYLKLNGTGNQNITGKGTVVNLELNNAQGATINNGDTVHVGKHYKPTNGTLTTNNGLELLSDSSGTAVILANSSSCNYIVGEVICDKYIHGGRRAFRFLGHPFSQAIPLSQLTQFIDITGQNGAANGFTTTPTNNPSSFWYNTLTGNGSSSNDSTGWIPFTNTDGQGANAWKQNQGIRVLVRGSLGEGFGCCPYDPSPVTIKTHGPVNMCDVVVNCQTNANAGFNLISNPFAANIDISQASRGSAVGANFSVWDPNQGTSGAYVAQPFSFSYILPAYSSFVTTCTSASNNTITFHESDKTANESSANLFKTTSGFGSNVVQLRILSNNDSVSWDRLLLFFDGQALALTDPLDNAKLANPALDFYTLAADSKKLSVDVRPYTSGEVIPLGLRATVEQQYTIRVDDYDVPAGAQLYLHDKFLNQLQPLSNGMHYNFTVSADPASQGDGRFEINVAGNPSGIAQVTGNSGIVVNMMPNPASDNVIISYESPRSVNTTITLTNLMGQVVYRSSPGAQRAGSVNVSLKDLAQGVYMVNVSCGEQSITKRLIKN